jgi:nitrogen-specific signal transduction histidine kinase
MSNAALSTEFAPAERKPYQEIFAQAEKIADIPILRTVMDAVPVVVMILNRERQIVFANRQTLGFLQRFSQEDLLGLRPGEALSCNRSKLTAGGCGTTRFCEECGAIKAILKSHEGTADVEECHITRFDGDALDLKVWATPLEYEGARLTFFALSDISDEKRRRILERLFFHDILNTVGSLYGFADLLTEIPLEDPHAESIAKSIFQMSKNVIYEIQAQQELAAAESKDLVPSFEKLNSMQLLERVTQAYASHQTARDKEIVIDKTTVSVDFVSDQNLLKRVIGNMAKNALEASKPGDSITLGCRREDGRICFYVHNPGYMQKSVQLQVFQRSFSTKGVGRGLGTYSIKLLTTRYLGGEVHFDTSPEKGTTFTVSIPPSP